MQSTIGLMWLSYKEQYVTSKSCYRWKDCWGWKGKVFPSWQLSSLFPLVSSSFQAPHFSALPLCASLSALICWFWKGSVDVCSVTLVTSHSATCGLQPTWLLRPWDSPGKNTGVGCHALLQGIVLIQASNPQLLHCRQILYCWATRVA